MDSVSLEKNTSMSEHIIYVVINRTPLLTNLDQCSIIMHFYHELYNMSKSNIKHS